jgi:hypothetical protein
VGVIDLGGRSLEVDKPAVVDLVEVMGDLPTWIVRTVRFNGARKAARVHISAWTAPASA